MKCTLLAVACLLGTLPAIARAQLLQRYLPQSTGPYEADPELAVLDQGGPDLRAQGVRVGDFVVRPELSETLGFDQNPLGLVTGAHSSLLVDSAASLSVQSDWSRNSLGASASIDDTRYPSLSVANTTSSTAFVGGAIDWGDNQIVLGAGHVSGNLSPNDVLSFGIAAPVPYQSNDARAGLALNLGPLSLTPGVDLTSFRFGRSVIGSDIENETGLDKNQVEGSVVARYDFAGGEQAVAVVRETDAQFLHGGSAGNYLASAVLGGLDYTPGGLFRYDVLVGFEHRQFRGGLHAIDTPLVEAGVMYLPTTLTTVTARLVREVADPTYNVTSDLTYTTGQLVVDHAFLRTLIWHGRVSANQGQANGSGGSRLSMDFSTGVTYLINRRVHVSANYDFVRASAGQSGAFVSTGGNPASGSGLLQYSSVGVSVQFRL